MVKLCVMFSVRGDDEYQENAGDYGAWQVTSAHVQLPVPLKCVGMLMVRIVGMRMLMIMRLREMQSDTQTHQDHSGGFTKDP